MILFSLTSFFLCFLNKNWISVYINQGNLKYIPKKTVAMIAIIHVVGNPCCHRT